MTNRFILPRLTAVVLLALCPLSATASFAADGAGYPALLKLFEDWRRFERPSVARGVADYTAPAMTAKAASLGEYRQRLDAIDPQGLTQDQRIDHRLVKAEMNGLDFDLRVLRPWARDPAFYATVFADRSDVPSREGPVAYPEINLFDFAFPLSRADDRALTAQLTAIPPLLAQARLNLADSNARDLWVYGAQTLRNQAKTLAQLEAGTLRVSSLDGRHPAPLTGTSPQLRQAIAKARTATVELVDWLAALAPKKTGPSGVGKENYTWYIQNVHLLPYTWEEEVALLRRELERSQASLRLEEFRNRNLPDQKPVANAEGYQRLADKSFDKFVGFLGEVLPAKPYIRSSLLPQKGGYVPPERMAFFGQVTQRQPMPLYSHDYHWIDLARMRDEPHQSPIRRGPALSNIWDSRAEGFATAFEEIAMHAGLYDDDPRGRELVWIMLANRAARGLASLYVQANEFDLTRAANFQGEWTPRGWSNPRDDLTAFEQLLYLRQPGYGTSYISGKLLTDRLLMEYSRQQEIAKRPFVLKEFFAGMNNAGLIPVPLIQEEMTGRLTSR